MPIVQEFGKLRQEDYKRPASLNYSRTIIKQNNTNHSTALQEGNMLACATDLTFDKSEKVSLDTYPRRISTLKTCPVSEEVGKEITFQWNVGPMRRMKMPLAGIYKVKASQLLFWVR